MSSGVLTDSVFIDKLNDVIQANLSNENFGVKELAEQIGMSHSQIHRRLKSISKKSISQFIREYRLEKGKEMLTEQANTVAEVSYNVGFGSPSYFNKCFHDYFGFPPGEYKKQVQQQPVKAGNEISDNADNKLVTLVEPDSVTLDKRVQKFKNLYLFLKLVFIALIILVFMLFLRGSIQNHRVSSAAVVKSIGVLPLTNIGSDLEGQYLAEGIMEDILVRLSRIHALEVKSYLSFDKQRLLKISMKQIAKELKVSYILEGSMMKDDQNVRLYIKLIDIAHSRLIWTGQYNSDLGGVFPFISSVSKQIADELEAVLSPVEIERIEKVYTENKEAYNLYLEGRFYWNLGGEEELNKSIDYYTQSLAIDSNYCLAYAGLADAYLMLSWAGNLLQKENVTRSKAYALKALEIDSNLAEAHATLAYISAFSDWNWELAGNEFEHAIRINPNYAMAHLWYSEYLDAVGRDEEAMKHINKALELNPHSAVMRGHKISYCLKRGNFDNALTESNKLLDIGNYQGLNSWFNFNIFLRQRKGDKALAAYKRWHSVVTPDVDISTLDRAYAQSGIAGILQFCIDSELSNDTVKSHLRIAKLYALLDDHDTALDYLEHAVVHSEHGISRIKYAMDFKAMRSNPRFVTLLTAMNLND